MSQPWMGISSRIIDFNQPAAEVLRTLLRSDLPRHLAPGAGSFQSKSYMSMRGKWMNFFKSGVHPKSANG